MLSCVLKSLSSPKSDSLLKIFRSGLVRKKSSCNSIVVFDIDGVVLRGHSAIPRARESLDLLSRNKIPFMFLTNGCPSSEDNRLDELSKILDIDCTGKPIVMAQSPLRELTSYHNQNTLFISQGDIQSIVKPCGFNRIILMDDVIASYPKLDCCNKFEDKSNKKPTKSIEKIDAIIIMDDPVGYEKNFQLLIDILLTGGNLNQNTSKYLGPYNSEEVLHVPIFALNTDYLWVTEAPWQRLANGVFIETLENIYFKLTGLKLKFDGIYGKPNLGTYDYLVKLVNSHFGKGKIRNFYFIGDNPLTDIYGANNFKVSKSQTTPEYEYQIKSLLVKTGVYGGEDLRDSESQMKFLHSSVKRDASLLIPDYFTNDALDAVQIIINQI